MFSILCGSKETLYQCMDIYALQVLGKNAFVAICKNQAEKEDCCIQDKGDSMSISVLGDGLNAQPLYTKSSFA